MNPLNNKIALITGASSGIGKACAAAFAAAGARVILSARRKNRLLELSADLKAKHGAETFIIELDVRDNKAVTLAFNRLPDEWQSIDVLVNNAGLSRGLDKLHEGSIEDWEEMIDTNVKGLLYVSRVVVPGMVARKSGTIVNIGSIAGHEVYPKGNVYCATKHAVDALTKGLRMDLVDTPIRVCTVDPGLVQTEFSEVRFRGDTERAKITYKGYKPLQPEDIADAVMFCASAPPHVQIAEVLILPTAQSSTTLVHKVL
ncbi:MAG: NAD(P)-dependent oxidoreductase [Ignavibacteria bacterium GWA2_55_11]|nr:MAG: NAD(P)-dependent oxidoreductase [Ignavibacteria bacterium GWA2_55_11]OGU71104.1 MAG: NAD(P)-dependent oxidoreductase [Ignavibacteria bacterium RIFCSPLOWO2_12_FULL_56_21]OGU73668.1 MAG: NAD(P)-dependent oxidoreductase [Ignavibacteria bacterium RIFCSPLOWO2_02_FULL_55_14]